LRKKVVRTIMLATYGRAEDEIFDPQALHRRCGHKTSVSLEDAFWKDLREIAASRHTTLSDLVDAIDSKRQHGNLSSAIRTFVLEFYRDEISRQEKSESIPLAPK
jgi:predicted DNA-binding ribbon-helix-helix protein